MTKIATLCRNEYAQRIHRSVQKICYIYVYSIIIVIKDCMFPLFVHRELVYPWRMIFFRETVKYLQSWT